MKKIYRQILQDTLTERWECLLVNLMKALDCSEEEAEKIAWGIVKELD